MRHTPVQRELRRLSVSERLLEGQPERTIAAALGVSQPTIHRDVQALKREWLERRLKNRDELVADELRFIAYIQKEALLEWRRSKSQPVQKRSSKSRGLAPTPRKPGEKVVPSELLLIEQQVKSEERIGDPRLLEVMQWCSTERSRLLGLHAPVKVAPTTPDGDAMYADPRERLLAVLEQKVEHLSVPLPTGVIGAGEQPRFPEVIETEQQPDGSYDSTGETGSTVPELTGLVIRR